jgi:PAS domain S-box-containing protein
MTGKPADPGAVAAEIESLIAQRRAIDARVQELTGGEVDAIIGSRGQSHLLQNAQETLLRTSREQRIRTEQQTTDHERLVHAQALSRIGSWTQRPGSAAMEWSPGIFAIFEADPGQCGPTLDEFLRRVHPDDRAVVEAEMVAPWQPDEYRSRQFRLRMPNGATKFVEQRWRLRNDLIGGPDMVAGSCQDITEQKLADIAVRKSEAQLALAGRLGRIGAWSFVQDGERVEWSDEVFAIHERPIGPAPTPTEALEHFTPEYRGRVGRALTACIERGEPFDLEAQILSARQRRVWVRAIGEAVRDADGAIVGMQGAVQDLSERKAAEVATRQLARRLTTVLEGIAMGFCVVDHELRFAYVNGQAEQILRRSRDDLIGESISDAYGALAGKEFVDALSVANAERIPTFTTLQLPPDPEWYRCAFFPTEEGLAVYLRDISAERLREQELVLMQASVAALNDMVLITKSDPLDAPGPQIVFVNDAFERITGYARNEVIGRNPRILQGKDTDRGELRRIRAALAASQSVHAELLNYRKSGEPYWVELDIVPVGQESAGGRRFVAVERDITERRRQAEALQRLNAELEDRVAERTRELSVARDQAEKASREKSLFLATMSHEIRTPMNGVIGVIDALYHTPLQARQREIVDLMRDSADVLLGIIDNTLDFLKIEAGLLQVERAPIDLAATIEKSLLLLDVLATGKRVALTAFVDPALPARVQGDDLRLRQVLMNLVSNAIKFSSGQARPGRIEVRAEAASVRGEVAVVHITVRDNGVGMDRETLGRLFTPFTQADASTTRRYGGTGLGLTISGLLVSLMGGSITVQSELDAGSTFIVELPFGIVRAEAANPHAASASAVLAGLRCRIVGRDDRLASDIARYLAAEGAHVERSPGIDHAVAVLPGDGVALWLLLPDVEVHALIELRSRARLPDAGPLPLVLLGHGDRRQPVIEAGDCLRIDVEGLLRRTLVEAVAQVVGRSPRPAATFDADTSAALTLPRNLAQSRRGVILVADDNRTNREVIDRQLELLGYGAEMAEDGQQALERLARGGVDLLLTDLRMPELDGYALTAAIRAGEGGDAQLPIIALTANALPEEEDRCLAAGMNGYLVKPVRLPQFQETLARWLPGIAGRASDASVAAGDAAALDLAVLESLIGDDPADVDEVLRSFRSTANQACREIEAGFRAGELREVNEAAHRLKSGARSVGASQLAETCARLEAIKDLAMPQASGEWLPALREQMKAVNAMLDARAQSFDAGVRLG